MGDACKKLDTPVSSGSVRFAPLQELTDQGKSYPVPIIGMLGKLDDTDRLMTPGFKQMYRMRDIGNQVAWFQN
jgi:phosphoribosylformylglycinamidine (FGAM) synthase-like enzyme